MPRLLQDLTARQTMIETAYDQALTAVAMGLTKGETAKELEHLLPCLPAEDVNAAMLDAYRDSRAGGVEAEDIDPSWKGTRQ